MQPNTVCMRASPLRVLVVGALSRTGQHLARTLAARDDFCVTALCGRAMGELIADDNGSILDAGLGIRFLDGGSVVADAVVIATDDPPPKESLEYLLQCCSRQGVSQTVLLSRIGASKDGFGLRRWKDAEGCASALPTEAGLTIVRCAQPLIGGPYYALDPDLLAKSNAAVADQWKAAEVAAGDGCHVWGEHVHASVVGRATLEAVGGVPTACVVRDRLDAPAVPAVGDVVVGRVTRVNPRMAHVDILVVRGGALREASTGLIRREDVRDYEADRVEIYRSFRPGDVVRARVLSLGDARAYYLTTAAIELGVIFAQSAAGHTMAAVSWEELECPVTKERAFRKVAKPAEGAAAAAAPDDAT